MKKTIIRDEALIKKIKLGEEFDAQGQPIKNVPTGVESGDAVNKGQLLPMEQAIGNLEYNQVTGVETYRLYTDLPNPGVAKVLYKVAYDPDISLRGSYLWTGTTYLKVKNDEYEEYIETSFADRGTAATTTVPNLTLPGLGTWLANGQGPYTHFLDGNGDAIVVGIGESCRFEERSDGRFTKTTIGINRGFEILSYDLVLRNYAITDTVLTLNDSLNFLFVKLQNGTIKRYTLNNGDYECSLNNRGIVVDINDADGESLAPYVTSSEIRTITSSFILLVAISNADNKLQLVNMALDKSLPELVKSYNHLVSLDNPRRIGTTITLSGFNFIFTDKTRIRIANGTYSIDGGNKALVSDKDGILSIVESTLVSSLGYYTVAWTDSRGTLVRVLDNTEEVDSIAGRLALMGSVFVEFYEPGVYSEGVITQDYGGYHTEILASEGCYRMEWALGGEVRQCHAVDYRGVILSTFFSQPQISSFYMDCPIGTKKLLLSSYGNPTSGYMTRVVSFDSEAPINDKLTGFEVRGSMWGVDGLWRNADSDDFKCMMYNVSENVEYDLLYYVKEGDASVNICFSSLEPQQLNDSDRFDPVSIPGHGALNALDGFRDTVVVNGYTARRYTISNLTVPSGAKSCIIQTMYNGVEINGVQIYNRIGAKSVYSSKNIAGERIVICGDSVSQEPKAELGKEKIRDQLGCKLDTYGIGGSGWSINATPNWVTDQNVSGLYQVEELVKDNSESYDVYLLSCTLNDPITHEKAIGDFDNCKPYIRNEDGTPDLTDSNLDTMVGALNFSIQRIYEKNPKAKIVLGTMNKCFLTRVSSGFGVEAGWNPLDTTTNAHDSTYYEYVEAVRMLGEIWGIPVADMYKNGNINNYNKATTMDDQYHPNWAGYEGMWAEWFETLLRL